MIVIIIVVTTVTIIIETVAISSSLAIVRATMVKNIDFVFTAAATIC